MLINNAYQLSSRLYFLIFALRVAREMPKVFDAFDLFHSSLFRTLERCIFSMLSNDISEVVSDISWSVSPRFFSVCFSSKGDVLG